MQTSWRCPLLNLRAGLHGSAERLDDLTSSPLSSSTTHKSPTMPREVSDIKTFIEICRRKDASCTFTPHHPYGPRCASQWRRKHCESREDMSREGLGQRGNRGHAINYVNWKADDLFSYSCADKEELGPEPDQVQGPMPPLPLHSRP